MEIESDWRQVENVDLYLYQYDTSAGAGFRYRAALWSLGGDGHWRNDEQEKWVLEMYGSEIVTALRIASGLE